MSRSAPTVILHQTESIFGEFPDEPIDTNEVNGDETVPSLFSNSDNSNDINETTNKTFSDNVDMANDKAGPPPPVTK